MGQYHRVVPTLAIATCVKYPTLLPQDAGLISGLRAAGIDARFLPWDDPAAEWSGYDAVVLNGVWGYHRRCDDFHEWLSQLGWTGAAVWNSPDLVRWNSDKTYLRQLEERGVRIVPTVFVPQGAAVRLTDLLDARGWADAVVKPAISAGADDTVRISRDASAADIGQRTLDAITASGTALVQAFVPEVRTDGEWSLYFFDGAPSHAVIKRPIGSDYRVQPMFGGVAELADPPAWLSEQARATLDALPEPPVYARVDGVCRGREFLLMEVELIEPAMFFDLAPSALDRFTDVIAARVHSLP